MTMRKRKNRSMSIGGMSRRRKFEEIGSWEYGYNCGLNRDVCSSLSVRRDVVDDDDKREFEEKVFNIRMEKRKK